MKTFRSTQSDDPGDGLDEYSQDFTCFDKPSDDMVADIIRRRRPVAPMRAPEAAASPTAHSAAVASAAPRETTLAADIEETTVRLESLGRTLIVGETPGPVRTSGRLLSGELDCVMMVATPAARSTGGADRFDEPVYGTGLRIRGGLGAFRATAVLDGCRTDLSRLLPGAPDRFDLVLDLRPAQTTGDGPWPVGYLRAPGAGSDEMAGLSAELKQMVGVFEKPRFILHLDDICANRRSGTAVCTACVDICPVEALSFEKTSIRIDHAACPGCGMCAVVCPTGAQRCRQASAQDLLVAIQGRIAETEEEERPPTVIFHPALEGPPNGGTYEEIFGRPSISVPLMEIGWVGPEVWLGTLAYGAGRVVVQMPDFYPERLGQILASQQKWVMATLSGLGLSTDCLQLAGAREMTGGDRIDRFVPPANFSPFHSKRNLIRRSVGHLAGDLRESGRVLDLPEGAPFGGIAVDPSACTLCLACAGACPTGALLAPGGVPALHLTETECIQCGRCRQICPEQAVELSPRMVLDADSGAQTRPLFSQEPLACVRCGKAFAPPGLVAKLVRRLEGHWMYARESEIRRLQMCRDCRIRDYFATTDARGRS